MKDVLNVAVLGYGTVGSGIVEVITTNKTLIEARIGKKICVKHILDLRKFPGDPFESVLTDNFDDIINDPEVDVVCEAMGGVHPAYDFSKKALLAGKSVCTSNKAVVAECGPELMEIAREKNVHYLFEASVGGGIPIIRPLNECLTPEDVEYICGILNGTTNFILTKMEREGSAFADVLKEAQDLGYAERNPEADVEGYDAARKIAILSSIAYGKTVNYEEFGTEGITKITAEDFLYAHGMGATIKLLGMSRKVEGKVYSLVAPFVLTKEHPLYSVNDVFNGILVHGNTLGDAMFYGSGAGKLPTASAVVSDIVEIARNEGRQIPCDWKNEKQVLADAAELPMKYLVRISGCENCAKAAFGEVEMVTPEKAVAGEVGFLTKAMDRKAFEEACAKAQVLSAIRVF